MPDLSLTRAEHQRLKSEGVFVWRTHDGSYLTLDMIEDSHLLNLERWLLGRGDLPIGPKMNPDSSHWQETYQNIRAEIDRRGLALLGDDNASHSLLVERFSRDAD